MVTALDLIFLFVSPSLGVSKPTLIRTDEGQALLDAITQKADILPQLGPVPAYTRDPKDDKFVACALVGDANYLITEDKDMLVLEVVGDVRIVPPYDFLHATPR